MTPARRWTPWIAGAACTAALLYFLPLFHVVPLTGDGSKAPKLPFDAVVFVDRFWNEKLIPGAAHATNAGELVAALQRDRQAARRAHGRSVGLGGVYYFFVSGTGFVASVGRDSIGLSLRQGEPEAPISLAAGNIFGNAVRDGTGLLNVNDFPNSQDFNALSLEINRRIEQRVLPTLRRSAAVGTAIRFVGCAEIMDEETDLRPLRVVPFVVESP